MDDRSKDNIGHLNAKQFRLILNRVVLQKKKNAATHQEMDLGNARKRGIFCAIERRTLLDSVRKAAYCMRRTPDDSLPYGNRGILLSANRRYQRDTQVDLRQFAPSSAHI